MLAIKRYGSLQSTSQHLSGCVMMSMTMMTTMRLTIGQPVMITYQRDDYVIGVIGIATMIDSSFHHNVNDVMIQACVCCNIDATSYDTTRSSQGVSVKINAPGDLIRMDSTIFDSFEPQQVSMIALFTPLATGIHSMLPIAHHLHISVHLLSATESETSEGREELIEDMRQMLTRLLQHRFVVRNCVIMLGTIGIHKLVNAAVTSCLPSVAHALLITHTTVLNIQIADTSVNHSHISSSSDLDIYDAASDHSIQSRKQLPTMSLAIQALSEMIALPLLYSKLYSQLCVECPRGLLLSGPPGCGKTWSVRTICSRLNVPIISIDGSDLFRSVAGEAEVALIAAFNSAERISESGRPVMVFIDEIDVLCPHRSPSDTSSSDRLTAQLLALMDGVKPRRSMLICGATNHPNAIDPALRRPGRFDREIEMTVPDVRERYDILAHYTCHMSMSDDVDLDMLARRCIGYVGADLEALTREAALQAIKRVDIVTSIRAHVTKADFEHALNLVPASSQRSSLAFTAASIDVDYDAFNRLAGLDDVIERLQRVISWPIKHADTFSRLNIRSVRGVLLHGPPGSGKTSLVKAIASHQSMALLTLDVSAVFDSHVGEAERILRAAFDKARRNSPCVLFIDEIDAMVHNRDNASEDSGSSGIEGRIVSTLLNEMDGVLPTTGVLVIGATNRLDRIDAALLRPGRFDEIILVDKPNMESSVQIWHHFISKMQVAPDVVKHIPSWASQCCGATGAEIGQVVHEAAMGALRQSFDVQCVQVKHFEEAMRANKR